MLRELRGKAENHARVLSRRIKGLQLAVLFLSILTTGSLWATLNKAFPNFSPWFGAVLGTVLTVVTGYQNLYKLEEKYAETLSLYNDLGALAARLREENDLKPEMFWKHYKSFESQCLSIGITLPRSLKNLSEDWGEIPREVGSAALKSS